MKVIISLVIVALVSGAGIFIYLNLKPADEAKRDNVNLTAQSKFDKLQLEIASGAMLYDVRTKEEYDSGYFQNAVNIPLQDLQKAIYPEVPKDTLIYVYCRSGNRSEQAVGLLRANGYVNVTDLGGISEMEALGGKIIKK